MTGKNQIWDLSRTPNFEQKPSLGHRVRIWYISKSWQSYMVMHVLLVNYGVKIVQKDPKT